MAFERLLDHQDGVDFLLLLGTDAGMYLLWLLALVQEIP